MSLRAEALVQTDRAAQALEALCRQLDEKGRARGVQVSSSEHDGTIDFGWARCVLRADAGALALIVEAEDPDALAQVAELVGRHIERHLGAGPVWIFDGAPLAAAPVDRRDAMRGFHHRMRH